jgi:hypothetical protein
MGSSKYTDVRQEGSSNRIGSSRPATVDTVVLYGLQVMKPSPVIVVATVFPPAKNNNPVWVAGKRKQSETSHETWEPILRVTCARLVVYPCHAAFEHLIQVFLSSSSIPCCH